MFSRIKKISREEIETHLLFLLLVSVGIFMRFYNLNWDLGLLFHPDERNIANAVTKIHFFTQLNPQFFAYGGFSIYLYRVMGDLIVKLTGDPSWVSDWGKINLIGRFFSAFFSCLTCVPIFLLTKKLFKIVTALFTTILWAFCVSSIQLAHFATTESLLTLQGITLAYLALLLFEKATIKKTLLVGALFGISLATKTSAFLFAALIFFAYALFGIREKKIVKPIIHIVLFSVISFVVFFIFSPFTFLDAKDFLASMTYESGVATGTLPVVYTLQFNGTIPYVFQIENFFWQIGLLTPFGVIGILYFVWRIIPTKKLFQFTHSQMQYFLLLLFPLLYFLYVGSWHTKFIRYMLPFLPFFVIIGTAILVKIYEKYRIMGAALLVTVLTSTLLWSLAFFSIYISPQTRVAASEWIYKNIPAGSKIYTESWDDGLPISVGSFSPSQYKSEALNIYDPDGPFKLQYYGEKLSTGDYIVINSRRLYGTLIHLTQEYPLTSAYYKDLFAGKLGYERIAQFSSYPHIGPIIINDDSSEETFQVYDHPKVLVFKNTKHFSAQQIKQVLQTN